jgi:hypothetical protein
MAKNLTHNSKEFMEKKGAENQNPKNAHQIFKDDVTDAKIQKHLADEHDEITAQDISNIKTEMSPATQEDFDKAARREGFSKAEIEDIKNAEN